MQEGRASPSQVDAVMRDTCGFRMGPFELMDLTGIDVNFPARKIIYEGFFHDRRMTPSPYHESLYAAGRLGRKTGGGWYAYDAKGAKVDPGADHVTSAAPATSVVVMDPHNIKLTGLLAGDGVRMLGADDGESPILVAPIGKDCTTTAVELDLDPRRTVAVDLTGDTGQAPHRHDRAQRRPRRARRGRGDARQDRRQGDGDQGLARLHRPAHVRHDRQSRLRDGDDRHRLGAGRRHRHDAWASTTRAAPWRWPTGWASRSATRSWSRCRPSPATTATGRASGCAGGRMLGLSATTPDWSMQPRALTSKGE